MTRLFVVTLLLAAVALALKLRTRNATTTRAIKVTSRITINRGSMIAVVEVDGRRLLVGAAANQVNLLAELDEAAPAPTPTGTPSPAPVPDTSGPRPVLPTTRSTTLIDKARRMTTRTVEPRLRLPGSVSGTLGGPT